eukprot:Gb_06586 [translate_table: standard]
MVSRAHLRAPTYRSGSIDPTFTSQRLPPSPMDGFGQHSSRNGLTINCCNVSGASPLGFTKCMHEHLRCWVIKSFRHFLAIQRLSVHAPSSIPLCLLPVRLVT